MSVTAKRDDAPLPMPLLELVGMLVAMTAVVALAIDLMLPALDNIATSLDAARANDQQYIVSLYLIGFGAAHLLYGPLADRFGRKPVIQVSLGLFLVMSVICALTPTFELLLIARFFQGAAAAACRVIATAIARDLTSGRRMAEVMSMVMTAFMVVPVLAPGLGQLILTFAPWRWIFGFLVIFAGGMMVWLQLRLPETLHERYRASLSLRSMAKAYREVARHRQFVGYTLAAIPFFGGLYGFLATSQQVFVDHFGLSDAAFPLAFAAIASGIGAASYINSRLVGRLGQRRLSHSALLAFTVVSGLHAALLVSGLVSLPVFLVLLGLAMAFLGLIAANFSALTMEPVGHVAGTASAIYGFLTGVAGALLGSLIGQMYDGSPVPLIAGQAVLGAIAVAVVAITERGHLFDRTASARG
ncbi:multidrug effflux MFS transporter [Maricaulis sp. CAU 1757]